MTDIAKCEVVTPSEVLSAPAAPETRLLSVDAGALVDAFLEGRSAHTIAAYRLDLTDFAKHQEAASVEQAVAFLLGGGHGPANATALSYRSTLVERGLAAATVNRRLAALRSLVRLARMLGVVTWRIDVPGVRSQAYRDTRGPGLGAYRRLLEYLGSMRTPKSMRDTAMVRMMFDLGLRRGEVVGLDLEDVDLKRGALFVRAKGRTSKDVLSVPPQTLLAVANWLQVRGDAPGPLFTNFDRAGKGHRLTGRSVARIVKRLGAMVGIENLRPHGLRHCAVTTALDLSNGDVRAVQRFSRHRDLRTVLLYDDNRRDLGGQIARLVADSAERRSE